MRRHAWTFPLLLAGFGFLPASLRAFAGPSACADCHAQEHADWNGSVHAKAFNERFQKAWKEHGAKPACLSCHTTGHKAGTERYAHAGVTCESCHGPMADGHPAEKMPLPVSSEMCAACHKRTHQEWRVSRHGQKNIRCFDCHKAHGQGLRAGGGEALCGSCHPGRLKDFAHATHHVEGLTCTSCHMPAFTPGPEAIQGTGAPGHSLSVGAEVCARCHEETVHKSTHLNDLRQEVSAFQKELALSGSKSVFDLNEKVKDLEWRLDQASHNLWLVALLGLLAGLGVGWLLAYYLLRRKGPR